MRRPWTTSEIAYLLKHAGCISLNDICQQLGRSATSVKHKASWLRDQGYIIDLRHYESHLETCPACGCLRSTLGRDGICEPCRRRSQLEAIHRRIAYAYRLLPQDDRDRYSDTESCTESRIDPIPEPPSYKGLTPYERSKTRDKYEIALETWAITNLQRQIKAAQKRKERICKKIVNATN